MSKRIVERTIASLVPPDKGNSIIWDTEIPGFGARITNAGAVSFVLDYRIHGRQRRITVGRHPELSVTAARNEARDLRKRIHEGHDPLEERERSRTDPTIKDLTDQYLEHYAVNKRPTSQRNDKQMIDRLILPALSKGKLRLKAIGRRDIEALHTSLKETPYQANRVLSLLSKMFSLGREWKWLTENPAKGIPRYHEDKRENWLTGPQIQRFREALDGYSDQNAADALRLLLLTGSRAGEAMKAEWEQFDLQRGVWTKPSHATKQKREEHVPLSAAAIDLLLKMKPKKATGPLFPGAEKGTARVTLRNPWMAALKAAGLTEATTVKGKRRMLVKHRPLVRVHDLRHSYASHLVSNGVSLQVVGKLLGHVRIETTQRYAHLQDETLRAATNQLADIYTMTPATAKRKKGA